MAKQQGADALRQPPVVLIRGNFVPVLTWISFYEGKDFCQFSPSRGHATHNPFPRPAASVTWLLNDKSVSSSAELDQRLCLWKPQPFEKGWRKLLFFPHKLGAARQRVGFRTKPIHELGAGSACSVFTLCVGALLWDTDGVDHLVILLLHLGFGSDAGQLHRLQRLIDAV